MARDEIGVLSLPAKAGLGGERLLHNGRSVDEHLDVAAGIGDEPARKVLQSGFDQLVIVVARA